MRTKAEKEFHTEVFAEKMASIYQKMQTKRPLVQCITNAVTVNDCANILLAAGASPTMAHHSLEVSEIAVGCDALVCNFGAIAEYEAMEKAAGTARKMQHPVVIDPVGVSGSTYRRTKCLKLIETVGADCIRGNYSEMEALIKNGSTVVGVDAMQRRIDTQAMKDYAKKNRTVVLQKRRSTDGKDYRQRMYVFSTFRGFSCRRKFSGKCGSVLCIGWTFRGTCCGKDKRSTGRNDELSLTFYRHNFADFATGQNIFKE